MSLPVAHALIGASIGALAPAEFTMRRALAPMAIGAVIAVLPDADLFVAWGLGGGVAAHGTYTHSILFALGLGSAVALVWRPLSARIAVVFILAVLSHGLLDSLTKDEFGGAALFWPFSKSVFNLGLLPNYEFYPNPARQSWMRILMDALPFCLRELRLFLPLLLLVLAWRFRGRLWQLMKALRRRRTPDRGEISFRED